MFNRETPKNGTITTVQERTETKNRFNPFRETEKHTTRTEITYERNRYFGGLVSTKGNEISRDSQVTITSKSRPGKN